MTESINNDIIKADITTKLSSSGEVVNPMNEFEYSRIKNILEKEYGFSVLSAKRGSDDERYLEWYQAEAFSDEKGIIHRGDVPSASAFFEEIVHCEQIIKYGTIDKSDWVERSAREVAANRKILNNAQKLGFTVEDFDDIKRNLQFWETDFIERVGLSYDEANIKRDVPYIIGVEDCY